MKMVVGGLMDEDNKCSATADCTGCRQAKCSGANSCTATDNSGVTCDGVETKCVVSGQPGCI